MSEKGVLRKLKVIEDNQKNAKMRETIAFAITIWAIGLNLLLVTGKVCLPIILLVLGILVIAVPDKVVAKLRRK
jgi:hypothetical protein